MTNQAISHPQTPECLAAESAVREIFFNREHRGEIDQRLKEVRSGCPVHHSPSIGGWVLTRYEDVRRVLRDQSMVVDYVREMDVRRPDWRDHPAIVLTTGQIISTDGPEHQRLRRIGLATMNIRFVEHNEERIRRCVHEIVEPFIAKGGGDFVTEVANPVTANVIGEVMGLPRDDLDWYLPAVSDTLLAFAPDATADEMTRADNAAIRVRSHWEQIVADRQHRPRADLVSELLAPEPGEDGLTPSEVASFSEFLFSAGFETTAHTLSLGLLAFIEHPEQFELLRTSSGLVPNMVEEILRYTATIVGLPRIATTAMTIDDAHIDAGAMVYSGYAAANRDPEAFPDPDAFDIRRSPEPHMTFGYGRHLCLGAPLARAEIRFVFEALARTCTSVELAGPPERYVRLQPRGLTKLPISLTRAADQTNDPVSAKTGSG